jgi:hypothetical protein
MKKKQEQIPTLEEVNDELGSLTSPPKKKAKEMSKKTAKALKKNEQEMDAAHVELEEVPKKSKKIACGMCGDTKQQNGKPCAQCCAQRIRRYDSKGKTVDDRVLCAKHAPVFLAEAKKNKQKFSALGEVFDISECEQCKIDAYEEDLRYGAHIHVGKDGECFFRVGDISIRVEGKDPTHNTAPESILKCLNGLLDSQVQQLAQAYELPTHPFVRELVEKPIIGWIQNVWYRDIIKSVSDHLKKNQSDRIAKYRQQLNGYEEPEAGKSGDGAVKARKQRAAGSGGGRSRSDLSTKSFKFLAVTKEVAKGRESDLLEVMKKLKQGTFADIVKAAEGVVKTKQKFDVIVSRFLKELIEHKAIVEVS